MEVDDSGIHYRCPFPGCVGAAGNRGGAAVQCLEKLGALGLVGNKASDFLARKSAQHIDALHFLFAEFRDVVLEFEAG